MGKAITQRVTVPTIGIGAGPHCDGQVQVFHDMMGFYPDFVPKHAKVYAHLGETVKEAARKYIEEVRGGSFPGGA